MEEEKEFPLYCTLLEMIDEDYLDHGLGRADTTDGFTLGKRGKAKFYMYDPTSNGYYKIYQQNENFEIVAVRYVLASQMVTVHKKIKTQP